MDHLLPEEIFKTLSLKYYVINTKTKRIVQTNDDSLNNKKKACFKQIFNKESSCYIENDQCICERLLKADTKARFIVNQREPSGDKYFEVKATKLEDDLVLETITDVTNEELLKKELKINNKRLERAEKLANFGYWEFNIDDKIVIASEGAKRIYGVKDEYLSLSEIQKYPLEKYRKKLDESLHDLIVNDKPYNDKFEIRQKESGEIRCVRSVAEYRKDKNMVFGVLHDITENEKAQNALAESLKNLKMAQQIAKIGNWQFDPTDEITEWSEEIFKILEREPDSGALKPMEYQSVIGESNYNQFIKSFENAVKKGISFQFQFKTNISTFKTKWIEIICQPESEPGPKGYKLRGTIQDIDEKKQIEVELNNSNELLRTLIDNIPDAIYMKDKNFRKVLANKIDAQRSNLEIKDMIGKSDYEIYPRNIAESYSKDDREVFETGMPVINREEILPIDDKFKWVLTSKIPLKDDENNIIGLVGIGRDITEFKENESRLRLLQQVIEQSPLSVVVTDTNGTIQYVNPGFEEATGYSRQEAIGETPKILNSGTLDKSYYKNLWETILSGKNWYGEFHNKRKNGTLYWESAVIAPIFNENNEIKQFVAIKEDVTSIKQLVKDIENARKKAEESDRLKTVFLANMSHEIRTPLNGILGFSSIISSGMCDNAQLEKYGKIIENSGQRLITVIDDIIDISMIQSNQLKIELNDFDLNDLLEEIYIVYKNQKSAQLENIRFEMKTKLNRGNSNIVSDKNRIYQVLKNLLDNAFKFTESGHITFGCYDSDDSEVVLYVEDTGIGIEEGKTNLIFEIFRQVEEGNARKYDGSGLGLAITSGIVERLGGEIVVRSEINKGTTFYVTLPRNSKIKRKINGNKNQSLEIKGKENKFKKIVSFEDDRTSSQYLKIVIDLLGYELINFDNASEGIEYLRKNKADLILMDAQLPGMSGYEATQIIKLEMPGIPVIMQSAYVMKSDIDKAIKAGCDDYLSKPASMSNLKEKIEKFFR